MLHFLIALVFLDLGLLPASSQPHTSTHWVVTENGLIRPRENSPFNLARPYDLIGLLNQESIYSDIINSYEDLILRQETLNLQWLSLQQSSNLKSILTSDSDCIKGGPMDKVDLYSHVLDTIRTEVNVKEYLYHNDPIIETEPPDCETFSNLPFSMLTFDHLEAMIDRSSLSIDPDTKLKMALLKDLSVEEFGNRVTHYLKKNESSWLDYNFGSIYWKILGNAEKALECSRRAVYFAPRIYKDIALLNLGSIFMRCRKAYECHAILSSALDHAPQYAKNHFALGNAYALLGDLNSSIACYDKSIQLEPTEGAFIVRHSVMCQHKLAKQLEEIQRCLRLLRANLTEYGSLEFSWWKQQAHFLNAMDTYSQRFQDLSRTSMNTICAAMSDITQLDFCGLKSKGDRSALIGVILENSELPNHVHSSMPLFPTNAAVTLEKFIDNIDKQMSKINSLVTKSEHLRPKDERIQSESTFMREFKDTPPLETHSDSTQEDQGPLELDSYDDIPSYDKEVKEDTVKFSGFKKGTILYPPTYKVNRNREDFDTEDNWPPEQLCDEWASKFPANLDTIYPVFLPFENKGISIQGLLSDKIGLTLEEEHPLPWHPPVCREVQGSTSSALPKLPKGQQNGDSTATADHLRAVLLNYVSNGNAESALHMHEAEIGQRILTAYKKKVAPAWIIYTLSSLYWRVRRNYANALTCLVSASKLAPAQYRDVAHASLASVLLQVGYADEALSYASQAFRISSHEPATNFLLSLIHMSAKNRMAHIYHMRQVVRVNPDYMDGLARKLLYAWSCKYASGTAADMETSTASGLGDVCLSSEQSGHGSTCAAAEADSCLLSSVHSLKHNVYRLQDEISTIMRLLDLKTSPGGASDAGGGGSLKLEMGDVSEKKQFTRKLQYIILDRMLKNCGSEDCNKLYPVRASAVHSQPCFFQHLRFWYWFPYIHLETLLKDRGIRIPKLTSENKFSSNTFPDCKLPKSNGDPMLEWLSNLDTNGWSSFTALITEVTVLLGNKYRVEHIGSVLANEVQHSGSWLPLLLAGVWCGGRARGGCCARCLAAALHAAPRAHRDIPLLALVGILHLQDRAIEAKKAALFALTLAPQNKLHQFVVGITCTYVGEYATAILMFRMSLSQQADYEVARSCLHATMCLVYYADDITETKGLFFN